MDLAHELDGLRVSSGGEPITCGALQAMSPEELDAIRRTLARGVKPTTIGRKLRSLGVRVSEDGFREHAKEVCPRCRISLTS